MFGLYAEDIICSQQKELSSHAIQQLELEIMCFRMSMVGILAIF